MLARSLALCDKPERNIPTRKAKGQIKAGRTGTDDQHGCRFHGSVSKLSSAFTEIIAPYPRLLLRQIASRIDHVTEKNLLPIYVDIGPLCHPEMERLIAEHVIPAERQLGAA
jgi:hypothetical protein